MFWSSFGAQSILPCNKAAKWGCKSLGMAHFMNICFDHSPYACFHLLQCLDGVPNGWLDCLQYRSIDFILCGMHTDMSKYMRIDTYMHIMTSLPFLRPVTGIYSMSWNGSCQLPKRGILLRQLETILWLCQRKWWRAYLSIRELRASSILCIPEILQLKIPVFLNHSSNRSKSFKFFHLMCTHSW